MENESFLSYPTKGPASTEAQLDGAERRRTGTNVRSRIATFFGKKSPFKSAWYRSIIMGIDINVIISQVMVFLLLQQSTKNGDLPFYISDLLIVLIAAAVVMLAPFISWLGFMRRRRTMLIWSSIACISLFVFVFTPPTKITGSEFCSHSDGPPVERASAGAAAARLALLASVGFIITISGVAAWNHGVAYIYENNRNISGHVGILVAVKFVVLSVAYIFVAEFTLGSKLWLQVVICFIGLGINLPQLLVVPEEVERQSDSEQGMLTSLGRVLSNRQVMSQIIAMSIFSTGLWGFGYNTFNILRASYFFQEQNHFTYFGTRMVIWHFVIGLLAYYSIAASKSAQAAFDRVGALKTTVICFVCVAVLLIPMGLWSCEKGNVAGLSSSIYAAPSCSSRCGCNNPALKLQPVCLLDDMTTYLSPCHAGCSGLEDFSGIRVLANCTCGTNLRRATPGACNATACDLMASLHHVLTACINIFSLVAFKKQLTVIMDAVDARDTSVALGVATSVLFVFTFVCGHIAYFYIGESTCLWSANEVCLLHQGKFSFIVIITSASLTVAAALLTIVTILIHKKRI